MNLTPITIDLSYLYSLTGGDKSFEQELLTGTVEDVDIKINGLKESWKAGDSVDVRKNAHSLVTLAAIAGMPQVEIWSRSIDEAFSDGAFHPEFEEVANNIIEGWPAAKTKLNKIMATG